MRRIVVIAASSAGLAAAAKLKRRMPEHEINVVVPSSLSRSPLLSGPAGRRCAAALPNLELAASRELGLLEADNVMPDLAEKELVVSSSRGKLPVRYTDLVVEASLLVRIPRILRGVGNVFAWPQPDFGADASACDAELAAAAASGKPVLVAGQNAEALDAVLLALEAGAPVLWARTGDRGQPGLDPLLVERALLCLRQKGGRVETAALPHATADRLPVRLSEDGTRITGILLPGDGPALREVACALLTAPLLTGHPLLREEGVVLDSSGRISPGDGLPADAGLVLMGSGSVLPGAKQAFSGLCFPAWPGGEESAQASIWLAVDSVSGKTAGDSDGRSVGVYGIRQAVMPGLEFFRAGFSQEDAGIQGLETEYAVVSLTDGGGETAVQGASPCESLLALSVLCEKHGRTLIGAQVFACGALAAQAAPLFGMAVTALAEGASITALSRRGGLAGAGRLLFQAAGILCNKLETVIRGITPDEYLASRKAGAEFFTLDLRALPEWRSGHVPGAYSIPLPQLKKRLQDEVPRFTPLVLVSADGNDAYAVACRLAGLGATELYVLDGGMRLWPHALEREILPQ